MAAIISIRDLKKSYDNGFEALKGVSLDIEKGEIIALLGPNGAGKTTLIGAVCGLVTISSGQALVGGFDVAKEPRRARRLIGLVPQELALDLFETVWNSVRFTRGLFGLPRDDAHIENALKSLSLWDKKDNQCKELSGGMKRRVMIAKALSHNPEVLFLDEPTAGVDVNLRRDMWKVVGDLRNTGVTVILTTHYIEEAEEMADRVAVINKGSILLVEDKTQLMQSFGRKVLTLDLGAPLVTLPESLADYDLTRSEDGKQLSYAYDTREARTGITRLITDLAAEGIHVRDLDSTKSSLEDVFLDLVEEKA